MLDICRGSNLVLLALILQWPWGKIEAFGLIVGLVAWAIRSLRAPTPRIGNSSPLKTLLFPCQTTHRRLFPRKHAFSYSYLYLGLPVGRREHRARWLSVDPPSSEPSCVFSVHAADYLAREDHPDGLRGKLDDFLIHMNQSPSDYPHAYLVTAPRCLGYAFNPVSFWYLYDSQFRLTSMILEVNNTFGERRPYFLHTDAPHTFHASWPKDFHVSPFNSRKGSYSLSALDPLAHRISNTITLLSSKHHPKLVASVASTSDPLDPSSMTIWQAFRFGLSWFYVGFVTFPRILREAAKLFFKRKLHVWYRPEVLADSLGRSAHDEERIVATTFHRFLRHRIEQNLEYKYESTVVHSTQGNSVTLHVRSPYFFQQITTSDVNSTLLCGQTAVSNHPERVVELCQQFDRFAANDKTYVQAARRIRQANIIAWGSLSLLHFYFFLARLLCCWLTAMVIRHIINLFPGALGPRPSGIL